MDGRQNKQTTEVPLRRRWRRRPWFPQRFFQPASKHVCVPVWLFSLPPPTLLLPPAAVSPPLSPPSAALNAKATQRAAAELPHPITASCLTPKTGGEVLHICNNNVISSYKRRTKAAKLDSAKKKKKGLDQQRKHFSSASMQDTKSPVSPAPHWCIESKWEDLNFMFPYFNFSQVI